MIRIIREGFKDDTTPNMKYYAFDWDDNIVHMPTKIMVLSSDGEEIGMSTEDFAKYRGMIGVEPFDYNGVSITGYSEDPFRFFRTGGDKQFIIDALKAKPGPAFEDFKESINNGSIFSIITARGHNPETLKQSVYNYIISGFGGIDKNQLIKNLRKYRSFVGEEEMSDQELIKTYLSLNKYFPVSFGSESSPASPEELKIIAMDDFVDYIKGMAALLNKKAYLKKDLGNEFVPSKPMIGFSDDDVRNVKAMKKHYEDKPEKLVKTFYTGTGNKEEYK